MAGSMDLGMAAQRIRRGHQGLPQAGFTMVELLVTILMLSIVLVGLAALQISVIRQVTGSKSASEATRLAEGVMERYKSMPFPDLVSFTPKGTWFTEIKRDGASQMVNVASDGEADGPFTVESLHESVGGGELVSVRVTWTDVTRHLDTDQAKQYRRYNVTLSMQRHQ